MSDDELNTSNNSFNEGLYCEVCERTFTRKYSLQRHNKLFHDEESEEDAISDAEESEEDAMSDAEEHDSDQSTAEDEMSANEASSDEDEEEEEEHDSDQSTAEDEMSANEASSDEDEEEEEDTVTAMFRKLLGEVVRKEHGQITPTIKNYMSKGWTHKEAVKRALLESDVAKKSLNRKYIQNIFDIEEQRRDPLFKAIMKKAKEFMDDEGFDQHEAITAAVKFRKQAIYNMINSMWKTWHLTMLNIYVVR